MTWWPLLVGVMSAAAVVLACSPARVARFPPGGATGSPDSASASIPRPYPSRSRRERQLDTALPDVLDLLVVTLQAGVPTAAAFRAVAAAAPPPAIPALARLVDRLDRGDRLADALAVLVELWGTRALGLVAAVASAEVSGQPLAPTIDRLADDARAHRRRTAEADARRLPVRLAVPLVCCTLPSFVCIAIGPVVVGALSSLRSL